MKILFINLPYYGHIVPTVGLVQQLVAQGCEVTYMLPLGWEKRIDGSGADFYGYKYHKQLAEQMKNAVKAAEKIIADYDLVIYEQFFFLGKHLAEKHNKPAVRIFTAPATTKKLMAEYISNGGAMGLFRFQWIAKGFTKDVAKGFALKTDNWLDEIVKNPPELSLVYTLEEFQPYFEEFDKQKFKFIGPSIYSRQESDFKLPDGNKPLIYISLGTVIKGGAKFFNSCIDGFKDENVNVIISVGEKFNIKKLKNIPENIHIYPYLPQTKVLEKADLFITHGGMNSVSEAMVCGVPMVVIPFSADQPVNARMVEKLGIGKTLDFPQVTAHSVKNLAFSVMGDSKIKENLNKVQQSIEKSASNKGGAEYIIQYYNNKK